MSDWKSDMERKLRARQEAEAKREGDRLERERKQRESAEAREQAKRVAEHRRLFTCQHPGCSVISEGPTRKTEQWEDGGDNFHYTDYDDWEDPEGLYQCSICSKWFCQRHIEMGICKKDYDKGYLPGDTPRKSWW